MLRIVGVRRRAVNAASACIKGRLIIREGCDTRVMNVPGPERTLLNAILEQDVDAAQAYCAEHGTDIVVMLFGSTGEEDGCPSSKWWPHLFSRPRA